MTGKNRIKFNDIDWINKLNKVKKGFQTTKSVKKLHKMGVKNKKKNCYKTILISIIITDKIQEAIYETL